MNMEPLIQRLADIGDKRNNFAMLRLLQPLFERLRTCTLSTAGLVIKGAGSALVKTGAAITHYIVKGDMRSIAAGTDMPALSGTVTNAAFNVYVFLADSSGTVTSAMGTEGASIDKVVWPATPTNKAIIGYITVNPTGTGNFVGGTTPLDDATVVPNVKYISPVGVFDPNTKPF